MITPKSTLHTFRHTAARVILYYIRTIADALTLGAIFTLSLQLNGGFSQ